MKEEEAILLHPVMGLISKGLEIWIKSQCKSVEQLELSLEGSVMGLLKGNIKGVKVQASQVNFNELQIFHAAISSDPLKFKFNLLNKEDKLSITNKFKIQGSISFKGADLNSALSTNRWRWLGSWLSELLLEQNTLHKLIINNSQLELQIKELNTGNQAVKYFSLFSSNGGIYIKKVGGKESQKIPMDPLIYIENSLLKDDMLIINGSSLVKP